MSKERRADAAAEASKWRRDALAQTAAWIVVLLYNLIGVIDILSTHHGIAGGAGEEANPLIRAAMEHLGHGWIAAKLALQLLISFMVLWFPHRVVISIFLIAVAFNAGVVYSNLKIAGLI